MDAIYNNLNNITLLNNNSNNITLEKNKQITNENSNNNNTTAVNKTDSIEITEKDENKINKKRLQMLFENLCLNLIRMLLLKIV